MQPLSGDGHHRTLFFTEEDVVALQELDANERYVPLTRLCNTLGLDVAAELDVLQAHTILAAGLRALGRGDEVGLRVDLVPLWLNSLDANLVRADVRSMLVLFQKECASVLWQAFKPQGFGPEDALVPERSEMTAADQAYQAMTAQAALARQQMLIERQIEVNRIEGNRVGGAERAEANKAAFDLARAVRRVAHGMAERSRRNEYGGVFSGLYRQFGISSYRSLPYGRLREALDWLERWHNDILGIPEPPPDI